MDRDKKREELDNLARDSRDDLVSLCLDLYEDLENKNTIIKNMNKALSQ